MRQLSRDEVDRIVVDFWPEQSHYPNSDGAIPSPPSKRAIGSMAEESAHPFLMDL